MLLGVLRAITTDGTIFGSVIKVLELQQKLLQWRKSLAL